MGMHLVEQASEILSRITDGVVSLDREWRYTYVNEAAAKAARRRPEELIGRIVWEEFPDVVGTETERTMRRAFEEQIVLDLETHYAPLDLWVNARIYPSRDGVSIYFQDITTRKRAEAALAASEAQYRRIVETAHEGIWLVDASYRTTWANPRLGEIFGLPVEQLIGRSVNEFVHPDDLPLLQEQIAQRRQGKSGQYDIRMRRDDGETIWVLARIAPIFEAGTFAGALGMVSDITDRKRAELELEAQRQWFEVTLASIGDAVIATDAQGRITFMNTVAEELTKWRIAEARGLPLDQVFRIVNEETRQPVENPVAKVLRENRIVGLANHTSLIARDGSELAIDDSGAPIRSASGAIQGVVLVFRDNTVRAHAEKTLREADRRKDDFLAVLAHELRNPLAPIRSALEVLRTSEDPQRNRKMRDIMERQLTHLTRLVDDLLDVSRITRGKITLRRERIDLASVVARAVETISPALAQRGQRLMSSLPPEPLYLDADPTRIAQVISNLLHNASKFTPDDREILMRADREGEHLVLRVRDPGCGIPTDELTRIFEPFTQVMNTPDRAQSGLGLGLTLVKNLVELHGGRVSATSEGLGKGTELSVRLPLATAPSIAPSSPRRASVGARRIFIIDDNVDAAETLATMLSMLGHETFVAFDGKSALARLQETKPELLLLDLGMPGMTGFEVAQQLRNSTVLPGLKLVALSGYGQEDDVRRTQRAGFDAHIVKPVDVSVVQGLLHQLFGTNDT